MLLIDDYVVYLQNWRFTVMLIEDIGSYTHPNRPPKKLVFINADWLETPASF
jgi:hypothetical protein